MNDPLNTISELLSGVILPNLKAVHASQAEQIAANDRLEQAIEELRLQIESRFAYISAQLMACRAELAATQAALKAAQVRNGIREPDRITIIH